MSGENGPYIAYTILMMVLVGSSIAAHRIGWRRGIRYALGWAIIFALAYGLLLFRDGLGEIWSRAQADLGVTGTVTSIDGTTTRVPMAADGHFWVDGQVGSRTVRLLIDSGATSTVLSADGAAALGIVHNGGFPVVLETANGPLRAHRATMAELVVGGIVTRDLPVLVSERADGVNVLGMNWLSRLAEWRVTGREMLLVAP